MYKILFFMFSILISQTNTFDEGVSYYNNRGKDANGLVPNITNIEKAVEIFGKLQQTSSEKESEEDLNVGLYLIKSYYFMAQYASEGKQEKELNFNVARNLSETYIYKYPDSVELLYWNLAIMSNWAKLVGVRAVSKLGAAEDYREKAVDVIVMDPEYEDGGGYFLLGAVYFTAPYIPLIIPWPDDNKAVKYFRKAVETGRATPLQMLYLAEALIQIDRRNEAREILQKIINTSPSESNFIEDSNYIHQAGNMYKETFLNN